MYLGCVCVYFTQELTIKYEINIKKRRVFMRGFGLKKRKEKII